MLGYLIDENLSIYSDIFYRYAKIIDEDRPLIPILAKYTAALVSAPVENRLIAMVQTRLHNFTNEKGVFLITIF